MISELPATEEIVAAFRERFICRRCGACSTMFDGVKLSGAEMKSLEVPKNEWPDTFMQIEGIYYMKEPCRYYDTRRGRVYYI